MLMEESRPCRRGFGDGQAQEVALAKGSEDAVKDALTAVPTKLCR